ncbi:flagellar motor switch protein FliN [Serratia sp. M24T3]|uniref:flagellar motor switch protein FliN n=1 Tax=Serratia sp. M24T3 TaxID=932213 RepID=UPI00025BBCAE|nr:flagellar motor switch protein FliN [Serratia sp. M24T3]EIC82593.1 hypothetical protein SPM24T3_21119 [Serratia sp. M24T3]
MTEQQDGFQADSNFDFINSDDLFTLDNSIGDTPATAEVLNQDQSTPENIRRKMSLFSRIPVTLTLEVASAEFSLADLMTVNKDSVIELDKLAGEPLDVKVNGILFGKGEVVVINDKYGLRLVEFNSRDLNEFIL